MKQFQNLIVKIGDKAAKSAVCSASPYYCYQSKEPKAAKAKYQK